MAEKATKTAEFNKNILQLQKQLVKSRAEVEMLKDKLNCLIFLVKRSWKGDRKASMHLANIVGMEVPAGLMDDLEGRPASVIQLFSTKSAAEQNWERLNAELQEEEHAILQQKIQERQTQHLKSRSQFMDEVMINHYRDMSHVKLRQPRSWTLEQVDQHFLMKHNKKKETLIGPAVRTLQRGRSASLPHQKSCGDEVEQADLKLQGFFVGNSSLGTQNYGAEDTKNLFNADKIVKRKPRPFSSAHLREKDNIRAQPRSAGLTRSNSQAFVTQEGERSWGNKTTRPASANVPCNKKTPAMDKSNNCQDQNSPDSGITPPSPGHVLVESDLEDETTFSSVTPQAKNSSHLPQSMEVLSNDLKKVEEMERLFKNSMFSVQEKLDFT
ncbi:hypothetical protein C0Q70_19164 [Pomacea canaliculata]|uniref:Uncharacterized protein n=2 Tax=Pomacea canaliculata TaxID=400727 RepID=A0A2T7NIJ6_POMCA|nr:uncharacterized protein LOC112577125 isoform X2 [Pomacea canaliculata]PVD21000.1 hypothetical protein C0Q70_19164 [Pomacea canaliculata]